MARTHTWPASAFTVHCPPLNKPSKADMTETIISDPIITVNNDSKEKLEDMYQVVLWNDNNVEGFFVAKCLMQVFNHNSQLALKIMFEANNNGKAIAEVEGAESAKLHGEQLLSFGLTVTVEKI